MSLKRCLVIIFTFMLLLNPCAYAEDSFNVDNIYTITKELSQEKYRGRLAGDKGNAMAAEYIKEYFKKQGLSPAGDNDTYLQSFDVIVPIVQGSCSFKVYTQDGKLVKEYIYGVDFKELASGASLAGTVKGTLSSDLYSSSPIYLEVSPMTSESLYTYKEDAKLTACGIKAAIVPSSGDFRFRSPYKLQQLTTNGLVKIAVNAEILPELISYSDKHYIFDIKSSLSIEKKTVSNVVGMLKGWNPDLSPLVLSCHFDHVGFDADGTVYPGALDNASGTAMLLECINAVKKAEGGQPQRTIIFAAFNAEEEGLIGSSYFVEHPPVDISQADCINFDMVGSAKDLPLSLLCCDSRGAFSDEIAGIAKSLMVNFNKLYESNSDHASFNAAGINALTLIHDDVEKIHTPEDTIENVSMENLKDVAMVVDSYISYDGKAIVQDTMDEAAISSSIPSPDRNFTLNMTAIAITLAAILLQIYNMTLKKRSKRE